MSSTRPLRRNTYGNNECTGSDWELVVGEVYGFRSWKIDNRGRLISPQQRYVWTPGKNTAFDSEEMRESGQYPEGFYAFYDTPSFGGDTHGVIKASGHVAEGSRGFTAEFAEIVALVDRPRNRLTEWWEMRYAKSRLSTFMGFQFFMGAAAVLSVVVGFISLFLPPLWLAWLLPLGAILGLNTYCSIKAENNVDKYANKRVWLEYKRGAKRYSLKELYPNANRYWTKAGLIRAYSKKVEDCRPRDEAVALTPDDERFWQ